MSLIQYFLDYQKESDEKQKLVREMVLESFLMGRQQKQSQMAPDFA